MEIETQVKEIINQLLGNYNNIIIAIDGRCAAGKTTLAEKLALYFNTNIIHMDDFFLRPHQRTRERLEEPGGNTDYERFLKEVLKPLKNNDTVTYWPYDCRSGKFKDKISLTAKSVTIVEGSYSCHPSLWYYYDLHIFLNVSEFEQLSRINKRNPDSLKDFQNKWIPYEEKYFSFFHIMESCELVYKT